MAYDKPIKFRILELFLDGKNYWNYEIVSRVLMDYGLKGDYWRDSINFDLIELSSGGLLKIDDFRLDEEGIYKKNYVIYKYSISDFGRTRASESCLYV